MSRESLTDQEWESIRVFLPAERSGRRGRPWNSHRRVIDGILWLMRTGCRWKDIPSRFGKAKSIYNRFRRWTAEGLWKQIFDKLTRKQKMNRRVNRSLWCVDSSVIRAHRVASGARRQNLDADQNARKQALGRSRGGYSTKLHVLVDKKGLPLAITATPGQDGETPEFDNLIASVPFSLHRKSNRPKAIAGDKAYSAKATREKLRSKGIADVIPKRKNEKPQLRFSKATYRHRNIVERHIGWLKEYRRIATRYDKLAQHYLALVMIAAIRINIKTN